jgi:hypothetical protein
MKKTTLFALALSACSRSEITTTTPPPTPTITPIAVAASSTPIPALATAVRLQTTAERVADIDWLLSQPLIGTPEDADRRFSLRAERNALLGIRPDISRPSETLAKSTKRRHAESTQNNQSTAAAVVAPDSRTHDDWGRLSPLERMTPLERAHYLELIKTTNTDTIDINHH